jgi:PAS domain S-box-containing protein
VVVEGPYRKNYSTRKFPLKRPAFWSAFALALILFLSTVALAAGAEEGRAKRVLIISTGSRLAPGFIMVDQQLLQALGKIPSARIETYAENLDVVRFTDDRVQRIFSEYLSAKYAEYPPDLIILVFVGNLGIPGKLLPELFPGTPVIVAGLTEEELRADQFGSTVSGIAQRVDPRANLELILRLHPELRRLVVIGGTAGIDRTLLDRVKEAARPFTSKIEVDFWDNLTMAELRQAVTALPRDTAILFGRMFRDGAGQAVISSQVGQSLAQWASVPVYVMTDASFGTGAVGGWVASIELFGRRAGELASLVISGGPSPSPAFEIRTETVPTFDWRALQRWGIPESRLPAGSIVRFRPESFWEKNRWYIIGALLIIFAQSAMIIDLFLQRRRLHRMQSVLRENQQLMELATSAGELGLWSRDLKHGDVWANGPARSLFGVGVNDPIRFEDLLARVHPADRDRMLLEAERAEAAGLPFHGEFRVVLPDGTERWVLAKGRTIVEPDADDLRRMGVMLDITERKRAEEKVRESEERFRTVADAAPVMIWMSGTDKLCNFFNKGWLDFRGRSLEQELDNGWVDGVHPDDLKHCLDLYRSSFDARREFTMEYRLSRHDAEYRWVVDHGVPRFGPDGTFLGYIGSCIDVTERKRAECESLLLQQELAHVSRVSTMGELAASLAHELNQPLTAILSNAQAAQRFIATNSASLDEVKEILADIIKDDSRAAEVIRQMRSLVKKEALEFALFDLTSTIREVVVLARTDAILHNIHVLLDIDPGLPLVRGDRVQLQQVLLNLLLNAFDAMKDCPANKREITVRAEHGGRRMVEITVADHGTGLPGDKLDKIFQPFYTTKPNGLGMGLSISRSIIEAHGGRLWAENNADCGATFFFTVPVANEAENQEFCIEPNKVASVK